MSAPPTGVLFYEPRAKPLSTIGLIQPGSYYQFYNTGTLTLTSVYADGGLTTPLSQTPGSGGTTAASDGRLVPIYLNPATIYRIQLYSVLGILLEDIDPYIPGNSLPSQTSLGTILYPQTLAESTVNATIVNFIYPPLTVDRYGTNVSPGTTDMGPIIKIAWNVAKQQGGGTINFLPGATYALTTADPQTPINLASIGSNQGNIVPASYIAQVYCLGGSNIDFNFNGAVLKSTATGASLGSGVGILFDNCTNIRLIKPNMTGAQVQGGGVVSLGAIIGGSGYINGTYSNVLMTGGTGSGCCCTIVVSGGAVTSVTPTYPGGSSTASLANGFQIGDSLSTSNANLGGSGSGFSVLVTNATGAGNIVATAAVLAFAVTSASGLSSRVTTYDLTTNNCYAGFWCIDGLNGNVSSNISLLGYTSISNGEYGVPLHNSGDNTFIENLNTFRVNRPHFFYGCQNVTIANLDAQQINYGFGSIIKSYNRNTRNISIKGSYRNAPGSPTSRISIQVQCDPALFPVAPTVKNIYITHDEQNMDNGSSCIEFDSFYSTGGAQASTCAQQLFDQIVLRGFGQGTVFSTVKFTTAAAQCQINYDNFESAWSNIVGSPNDIRNGLGFISSREFFCNIALTFGGTTVAGTGGFVQSYIADGFCKVKGTITLTAKNGTGQAAITLPFLSRLDDTTQSLCQVIGLSNMSGLGGTIIGALAPNSNSVILYTQAATGTQSVLDTNFTTTSSIYFDITYPI